MYANNSGGGGYGVLPPQQQQQQQQPPPQQQSWMGTTDQGQYGNQQSFPPNQGYAQQPQQQSHQAWSAPQSQQPQQQQQPMQQSWGTQGGEAGFQTGGMSGQQQQPQMGMGMSNTTNGHGLYPAPAPAGKLGGGLDGLDGLDGIDAFSFQGFRKTEANDGQGGKGGQQQQQQQQSHLQYTNLPLNQIPSKPADPFAPSGGVMSGSLVPYGGGSGGGVNSSSGDGYGGSFAGGGGARQMGTQQQQQQQQPQQQGAGMYGGGIQGSGGGPFGGGVGQQGASQQATLIPYGNQSAQQQQGAYQGGVSGSDPFAPSTSSAAGGGGLLALPPSTTASESTANNGNNPFQTQQQAGGFGNNQGGFNDMFPPQQPMQQQQQQQQQHHHQQVLVNAANPFTNQLAPAPVGYMAQSGGGAITAGGGGVGSGSGGGNWDPWTSSSAPVPGRGGTAQAGGSWDPFAPGAAAGPGTNGQQVQQQHTQMQTQQDDDWGLGELKDEDIWGTLPTKKDGDEDTNDWSDEEASEASRDDTDTRYTGRSSGGSGGGRSSKGGGRDSKGPLTKMGSIKQEQEDMELALRLQREEEQRASVRTPTDLGGGYHSGGGTYRSSSRDRGLSGIDRYGAGTGSGSELATRPRQTAGSRPDGECFARISIRTLLVKKWKPTYFIFELPDLLLLYRSRDDHIYNPKGTMIKKRVEVKHNHTLTRLKRKVYKEHGYLWHFTLEEQMDYGPSIVAKFAHHERRVLEDLGQRLAEAIREKRRLRQRFNQFGAAGAPSRYSSSPGMNNGRRSEYDTQGGGLGSGGVNGRGSSGGDRDKYAKWGSIS